MVIVENKKILWRKVRKGTSLVGCWPVWDMRTPCNITIQAGRATPGQSCYKPLSASPCTPRYLMLRAPLRNRGSGSITLMSSWALTSVVITNTVVATSTGTIQENKENILGQRSSYIWFFHSNQNEPFFFRDHFKVVKNFTFRTLTPLNAKWGPWTEKNKLILLS